MPYRKHFGHKKVLRMLRLSLLCLLPLVVSVTEQLGNNGIGYYGTSNVRYQKTYPPPLSFPGRSQSIPISTTTDTSPSTTNPASPTADVSKILTSNVNITPSSGPRYIPRRKPCKLPRRTRPESNVTSPKQQATQTLAVVKLQPNLFVNASSPKLPEPQPSLISAPQVVNSGPQTPINTTLETSTVNMPINVVSPTLLEVSAQPSASPVAVQPKKEPISFESKPEGILGTEPMSPPQSQLILQAKPEINPTSAQEQDPQPATESTLKSTLSLTNSNQVSYPIKIRPYITFVPVLESTPVEEPDTTRYFLNISNINQGWTTETPPKAELVASPIVTPSIATNLSSVNAITRLPIINTTSQNPTVTEIQPPLVTAPKLPLTETTAPRVIVQIITDPQMPLKPVSTIYQPDVTSVQLNRTADLQLPIPLLSTLNTFTISEATVQPKTEPASNVTDPNIILESELVRQVEPEPTAQPEPTTEPEPEPSTQPELETTTQPTFHLKPNLTKPEQISYAVKITLRGEERIEEYTTVPPLKQRGDAISEPSFTFETPVNETNQTLVTAKSQVIESVPTQIPIATSQPPKMTTSPQPEAKTTLQESVVIANNQPQAVSAPQVITELMIPPQPTLSVAPQLSVSLVPKPLAVIASTSRISEAPQKADQPELFSVSEVSDTKSELATPQESKQDARPNPEIATHPESEKAFEPEVVLSSKPYSYPVQLRPQVSFVALPDSAWKHVALKPQPAVLPPLLPRPNPIWEPAYGRHSQSTIQYPITSSTHHVLKISPIIKPTPAPFMSTPNTIWQPNYGRYTLPTTQKPIIGMTENASEVPLYNVSISKRPESFNFDFFCNEGNGYYTVDNECDTYILCQRNKATKFSCPDGLYFNPAAKYNEYPCVYPSEVQCIGSTGKLTEQLGNDGIGYYGTSNVRYQKTYPPPLSFAGRLQSIPISTTMDTSPLTTNPASPTADVPKISTSKVDITTSLRPRYIPRRKPFKLPRRTRLETNTTSPKQQATQTLGVVKLQPNLFVNASSPKLPEPQPSLISAPQVVNSGPRTPINTTLETSTVNIPINVVSSTLLEVSAQPSASPVAVQPKKEPVSFESKPEGIPETEPMSPPQSQLILQAKPEINPASAQEQDPQPAAESTLKSTLSLTKSSQDLYPIKIRPDITFVPVLESIPVEEPVTTRYFLNISNISQGSTTKTPPKAEPVAAPIKTPSIATNLSSVNAVTRLPIINTTSQNPTVTEIQPPLVTASKLPLTETTAPRVIVQIITDPQMPLKPVSTIYQPDVTSVQLNRTADLQLPIPLLSTLNTPTIYEKTVQPKTEPASNVTDPNIIVESELVLQVAPEPTVQPEPTTEPEPEPSAQPELETTTQPTFQLKPNLTTPEQISYAVKITPRGEERIEEYTTVPPLKQRGDAISELSFTFEITVNATSQPPKMTTSPQPEATTTFQESVVIANNQPQAVAAPQVITELMMPPKPSLSITPQIPVSLAPKPLAAIASTSRISEAPQKADQPELLSVPELSDSKSELATPQESKQDARPNPEIATHPESEKAFDPEVVISSKPYSYPVKLRPQVSFVAAPDSTWKHVALKPQPAVFPPLFPRPNPIREPAYGRHSQSTTQYPLKQPNYGRYTLPTTQNRIIGMTENTSEVPLYNVSISKRPESFNFHKTYPTPLSFAGRSQSIPISTTTDTSPSTMKPAPPTAEVLKISTSKVNITTSSGPRYIPRRKPFKLPRRTRLESNATSPKQQATQTLAVVKLQPNLFVNASSPTLPEPQPSLISAPQVVSTGPQTPINTTLETSTVNMPINVVSPTLLEVSAQPSASPVVVQPKKEHVSFESKPEGILETEPMSPPQSQLILQAKPEINPASAQEQDPQPATESTLKSKLSLTKSNQVSYPIKIRPDITFVPVLESIPVEEPDTTRYFLNLSNISQGSTTKTPPKAEPVAAPIITPSIATNLTSVNAVTRLSIINTTSQNPTVTEIQPPLVTAPKLPLPKTELVESVESELLPQVEPEPTAQPERTTEPEPENSAQPELETTTQPTFQLKPNLTTPEQISYAVKITPRGEERIEEYTTVPPLKQKGDAISELSFTFEITVNATSQPPKMTTSPQPEAATTFQESVVIANNQPQAVAAPQVITELMMPPQPTLSVAPQLPVSLVPKPLAVIASTSRISEAPQKADQPELFSVSEVSDYKSELATPQESKQDARPNPEIATHPESEKAFDPEVVISSKPYSYPIKLRPQVSFVAAPDSAWKHVALKPLPAVLPSLLPRPNPIREPAYGRHSQSTFQYPITSSTHHVLKISPIIKPTPAPFMSTPNTIWQPNYGRYTLPTTQNPIIGMTENASEVSLYNVSISKRPESFNFDFFCNDGNGYYTVDNECDTYILCQRNKATKFYCPDGLYFKPAVKYNEYPCVYPSEVQCIGSTGKQYTRPTVTRTRQCPKQYGLFSMNDGDCSKYIMCNIGVATVMNCPAGLVFNPSTESCDWVANVPQCNPRVFKDYTCPDPPVDEYGVATDIIYKYKYRNQCTQYIACQRGYPRLLSCERGLAFDEESQSCISSVYVPNCA